MPRSVPARQTGYKAVAESRRQARSYMVAESIGLR